MVINSHHLIRHTIKAKLIQFPLEHNPHSDKILKEKKNLIPHKNISPPLKNVYPRRNPSVEKLLNEFIGLQMCFCGREIKTCLMHRADLKKKKVLSESSVLCRLKAEGWLKTVSGECGRVTNAISRST